jgi:hypothetical protein
VTRVVTVLVLSVAVALSGLVVASPASAVSSTIVYTLDGTDPTMSTPLGGDSGGTSGGPCADDATAGTYAYEVVRLKPTATGAYTISEAAPPDGRIGLYSGAFSPAAKLSGCLAFIDDNTSSPFTVALTAGVTYTMVRSAGVSGGSGSYQFDVDGPGVLTVLTATSTTLTTTPNPSELSKSTTLRAVVAGGATPTGTVTFRDGATVIGSAPLSGGVAQLAVSSFAVGNHTLSAAYLGDGTHDISSGTALHKVKYGPKPKIKKFTVSDKTPYVGQKIKLTWRTTGADKVRAKGAWRGKLPKKGSKLVRIKKLGFHAFKIKATNVNGSVRAKVKVVAHRGPKKLTVTLPDDVLTVNTKVRVRADGLDSKERFKVLLDDDLLAKGFADRKGDVSALVLIPKGVEEGEHTLTVMGGNRTRVGSLEVLVLAPKQLDVRLKKQSVGPNGTQTVTVSGLFEGESVTVSYMGEELAEGEADEDGVFKYTFGVGAEFGTKTVEVVGGVPSRIGEATFELTPSPGLRS